MVETFPGCLRKDFILSSHCKLELIPMQKISTLFLDREIESPFNFRNSAGQFVRQRLRNRMVIIGHVIQSSIAGTTTPPSPDD